MILTKKEVIERCMRKRKGLTEQDVEDVHRGLKTYLNELSQTNYAITFPGIGTIYKTIDKERFGTPLYYKMFLDIMFSRTLDVKKHPLYGKRAPSKKDMEDTTVEV